VKFDRLSLSVATVLCCAAPFALAESPIPKQLSGTPAEFSAMRAPDPADAAIHSKSALLPISLQVDKAGGASWTGRLPVENGRARFLLFNGGQGEWQVELGSPDGTLSKASLLTRDQRRADFGPELAAQPSEYYALDGIASGVWTLKIAAAPGAPRDGFVLIEGDGSTELASYQTHRRQLVGERIGVAALLTATDAVDKVALGHAAGQVESARLRVTAPDGTVRTYAMADDGRHQDGAAGDGVYGAAFKATREGQYLAQVIVHGSTVAGQPLVRTAEHVIPVLRPTLALTAGKAIATGKSDNRLSIRLPVQASKQGQHYRAYAEVWGSRGKRAVPVAWVGGMVEPAGGSLELGFDQRWVALAAAKGPFELRNLRIEDPDHFVTMAGADRLPLQLPTLQSKLNRAEIVIDDEMRMGPQPMHSVAKGVGSRLLLVHGYCSGGVWPTSHFSGASTFLDVNQSRSNDQFARLIQSFGNTWNSYGVVAHSQGGMAAVHLYTYYWSGLDRASGNRLIQSVGTPYRGTNLAGILASLGSWFGVGCGSNSNLTYSGAQSWLAGIPTWARAKANYYTTSFRLTNWWTNDYCNFATDLVLSDPEDGTTEQTNGQLAGGINRGHTTGQCHTAGMRDPAQYNDYNRNWVMNSNAAR
jgi:hypothetical protein